MARPRYTAAKRAREVRKQEERARKLARKHGRARRAPEGAPDEAPLESGPPEAPETGVEVPEGAEQPIPNE
jgi:hypothetical protein